MVVRGGEQFIPRPPAHRPGHPPPWQSLAPEARRFTLDDVRRAVATLPPPRPAGPDDDGTPSAVLVPLFEEDGEARLILTKRPDTMAAHQGQIAFPGGKLDPGVDADLAATALREAQEEIGLDPASVEIVAELDTLATVANRFTVTPYVGLVEGGRPVVAPDPVEVAALFDVPLSELLDDGVFREERWDIDGLSDRAIHFFELEGETVWGATARVLYAFLDHLASSR